MADTTQEVENEVPQDNTQVETVEPTLDDLYKESGLQEATPQTQAQPQKQVQQEAKQEQDVPDPFDVENHKAYLKGLAEDLRATKESHAAITNAMRAEQQRVFVAKLEEDIKQAADFVAKESGIENSKLATFELNERARTDVKFKALWEGRDSSPQAKAAFTKALGVISRQIGKDYEVRSDPQLVANRKSLAASRQSSATTSQDDSSNEPAWGSSQGAEFQLNWERMVRNNN